MPERLDHDLPADPGRVEDLVDQRPGAEAGREVHERLVGQVRQLHRPPPGQPVPGRYGEHLRHLQQLPRGQLTRHAARADTEEADLDVTVAQAGDDTGRALGLDAQLQLDVLVAAPELARRGRQVDQPEARQQPDPDRAAHPGAEFVDDVPGALDRVHHRQRLRQQRRTGLGQYDALRRPLEQRHLQIAFERRDRRAHRTLHDVQPPRRERETPLVRHRDEVLQLPKLHAQSLAASPERRPRRLRRHPIYQRSTGKGVTATLANVLVARGVLGTTSRSLELWPEFAAHGKGRATLRHVLTHSVGVPGAPASTTLARPARLGRDDRGDRRERAVVGAGHEDGVPRADVRLPGR